MLGDVLAVEHQEGFAMTKIVRCTCGVEIRSNDEAELIAAVQAHAKAAHDLDLTAEQVLAMAEIDQA